MIPSSHHGSWRGPNRLWLEGTEPERSEGVVEIEPSTIRYGWSFRGAAHDGTIVLSGPPGALGAEWTDTFHAAGGMTLRGREDGGEIVLYGTYPAGDGPPWGWRIELDARDPEHIVLRMFNIEPSGPATIAVDLRGGR